jgi:hypothetical protein
LGGVWFFAWASKTTGSLISLFLSLKTIPLFFRAWVGFPIVTRFAGLSREQKGKLNGETGAGKGRSKAAEMIADFFDKLPSTSRPKLTQMLVREEKIVLGRHKRKPGLEALHSIIKKLDTLPNFGLF